MKHDFTWIDLYSELADKLQEFQSDRGELVRKIVNVYSSIDMQFPKIEENGEVPTDIDPFTVFGLFNKGLSNKNRAAILSAMATEFSLKSSIPQLFDGIPTLNNLKATFYWFGGGRGEHDIDNLWSVFNAALDFAANENSETRRSFLTAYNVILPQHGIRWNITMGLYWIRPYVFLNLDSRNRWYMKDKNHMPADIAQEIGELKAVPNAERYMELRDRCLNAIRSGSYEYTSFPELSYAAWVASQEDNEREKIEAGAQNWTPTDYDPGLDADSWEELLSNRDVFTNRHMKIMRRMVDIGGSATCKQLAKKYGNTIAFYRNYSSGLGQRVADAVGLQPYVENGETKWWPVVYVGRKAGKGDAGSFIWKLRPELAEALNRVDLTPFSLYEGKKGNDGLVEIDQAEDQCEHDEEEQVEDVGFDVTTLHSNNRMRRWMRPIIETIRALGGTASRPDVHAKIFEDYFGDEDVIDQEKEKRLRNDIDWARNYLNYEGFLDTTAPKGIWGLSALGSKIVVSDRLAEMIIAKWVKIKAAEREGIPYPKMDLSPYYEFISESKKKSEPYSKEDFLKEVFLNEKSFQDIVSLLMENKIVLLEGAPGVGKTFTAKRLAYAIMGEKDEDRIEFVQFHQSYSYEDFVMGYKPSENGFILQEGVFYRFCKKAMNEPDKMFFFIIDEINRGNLSKIFGELLMLIEGEYREQSVTLAYGGKMKVPENLYVIGMMNTADRSLALMDHALRRRFRYFEMYPGFDTDGFKAMQKAYSNRTYDRLIEMVKELNRAIRDDDSLGEGYQIGHSHFCTKSACTDEWLRRVVSYDIIPTLKEYWFDDKKSLNKWKDALLGVFDD